VSGITYRGCFHTCQPHFCFSKQRAGQGSCGTTTCTRRSGGSARMLRQPGELRRRQSSGDESRQKGSVSLTQTRSNLIAFYPDSSLNIFSMSTLCSALKDVQLGRAQGLANSSLPLSPATRRCKTKALRSSGQTTSVQLNLQSFTETSLAPWRNVEKTALIALFNEASSF